MKIVIGGASGLIGKRLVSALRNRGDEVCELVRSQQGPAAIRASNTDDQQPWDGATQGAWVARIDGADAVINLSGANIGKGRWTESRKKEILASRVDSTRALVTAMRSARERPKMFLSASAVGYYGPRGDEVLDEQASPGTDFLADVCVAWEAEAHAAEQLVVRVSIIRTGIVLASSGEGSALDQLSLPFKLFVGGPVGDGKQWVPWIHIEDEIAACLWALDHADFAGPFNAAAPGIANMDQFSAALGRALHRPSWFHVPNAALHLALGEFADTVTHGQRTEPAKLLASGFQFRYPSLELALRNLVSKDTLPSHPEARPNA
jgi:uncharacterized protein (TIGR01777 family)